MSINTDMIIDGGGSVGDFDPLVGQVTKEQPAPASQKTIDRLLANQAADEARFAAAKNDPAKQATILNRINNRQDKIDAAQSPTAPAATPGATPGAAPTPSVTPTPTQTTGPTYTAPDGTVFTDANAYVAYLQLLAGERAETDRKAAELRFQEEMKTQQRQSAFEVLRERFSSFGLTGLATEIEKIFKGEGKTKAGSAIPIPTSEAGFYFALTETQAYYDRFGRVNEMRIKSGYTALDERTILGMEDEYQKVLKSYGMPAGFYDTPEDFQDFLANNLSEVEVADRLQASRQFAMVVDPVIKDQLKSMYNIDDNMLTAYIADPEKGQKLLTSLAGRSLTGAAALLSGLTADAAKVAEGLGAGELRFQEQQQRFGAAQTIAERGQFLSQIERADKEFGEKEAVDITFGGLEQSRKAAERLASRERARFGGAAGTTTSSLATPTAGQF
jgi:hypothetical protein